MADMLRAGLWQANDEIPHATRNVPSSDFKMPASDPVARLSNGKLPEWLNGTDSKSACLAKGARVRIPDFPPLIQYIARVAKW